jgi:cobalt-zinc-cadmium efflux system protein
VAHDHQHAHRGQQPVEGRWLGYALALIVAFMAGEVVVGLLAESLALLSDAAHMLTDAASLVLALVAIRLAARPARGNFTFGYRRVEILAAQANGLTLLLLTVWFVVEAVRRLQDPPDVVGGLVLSTAVVGIAVNLAATSLVSRASRRSLNVEGAFQHLLTDLAAFVATAIAGVVVLTTGWRQADAVATLLVAALMAYAGWGLVSASWRVFLEAAPEGLDVSAIDDALHHTEGVVDIHDLHVWEVTSGFPALSAHILVSEDVNCHDARLGIVGLLHDRFGIEHSTLQVDHAVTNQVISAEQVVAGRDAQPFSAGPPC